MNRIKRAVAIIFALIGLLWSLSLGSQPTVHADDVPTLTSTPPALAPTATPGGQPGGTGTGGGGGG